MNSSTDAASFGAATSGKRDKRRSCSASSASPLHIAAIVIGFVVFWPIGLAILAWTLWRDQIKAFPLVQKLMNGDLPSAPSMPSMRSRMGRRPSNSALAEYLEQEQSRLKAEQHKLDELVQAFEAFKTAERQATDQRDFEEFLRHRDANNSTDTAADSKA